MLIVKYDRVDFFGNRIYTEDTKQNYGKEDLKKAFLFFGKHHNVTVEIDNIVIFWETMSEQENKVATIRSYEGMSYTEEKKSFEKVKKEIYSLIQ